MNQVTLIDPDVSTATLLTRNLEQGGFRIQCFADAESAMPSIVAGSYDLLLLDTMLPGRNGLDVCRDVRAHALNGSKAIILIAARADEASRIEGLEAGADDFVSKQVNPRELLARVQAVLRRRVSARQTATHCHNGLLIDLDAMTAARNGVRIELSLGEAEVLTVLLRHAPSAVSMTQLLSELSTGTDSVRRGSVEARIKSLRNKLGRQYIETRHGYGFAFVTT